MSQETIIEKIKKLLEINRANGATTARYTANTTLHRERVHITKRK